MSPDTIFTILFIILAVFIVGGLWLLRKVTSKITEKGNQLLLRKQHEVGQQAAGTTIHVELSALSVAEALDVIYAHLPYPEQKKCTSVMNTVIKNRDASSVNILCGKIVLPAWAIVITGEENQLTAMTEAAQYDGIIPKANDLAANQNLVCEIIAKADPGAKIERTFEQPTWK
ncbi:MAG: hypothetical protein Q4P33_02745 [Flaviflexus sp.]|nr:hypothetical protein [Flaviflexus sp.]